MKKIYYPFIAVSMTIISIFLVPIKSYAAGTNYSVNFDFDISNMRLNVTYNSTVTGYNYENTIGMPVDFNFTVNLRMLVPTNSSGDRPYYATGYAMAFVQIPITFGAGVSYSAWSYDYDVTYGESSLGVAHCIPQVRAQNNNLQIYYYVYLDDFFMSPQPGLICEATLNIHVAATVNSVSVTPGLTLGQASFTNNGYNMVYPTNPDTNQGFARIISLAFEHAILNSVDIDTIISYLASISILFPQYMDNILTALSTHTSLLTEIRNRLNSAYSQDTVFYAHVLNYLELILRGGETQASEAVSEATEVQEQMSQIAESLEVDQPSIDGAFDYIDGEIDSQAQQDLFFYLRGNNNLLVKILLICFSLGLMGYILYGRE